MHNCSTYHNGQELPGKAKGRDVSDQESRKMYKPQPILILDGLSKHKGGEGLTYLQLTYHSEQGQQPPREPFIDASSQLRTLNGTC